MTQFRRTTEAALRFSPPGHFYSPHPRLEDLEAERADGRQRPDQAAGIDLNIEEQLGLLRRAEELQPTGPWLNDQQDPLRFYYNNAFFRFGDSNAIWQIASLFRPQRVVEVGSGFSTACWLDTFDQLGLRTSLKCIEPYPDRVHQLCRPTDIAKRISLLEHPVQRVSIDEFRVLEANDVLFIDSTHVAKSGSDVNFLFFEVLPNLKPGVLVHVHDIFWPFDYPLSWYQEGRAWNECFLLRAFLQHNTAFRIIRFNSYLAQRHPDCIARTDPRFVTDAGGSIWLQRS